MSQSNIDELLAVASRLTSEELELEIAKLEMRLASLKALRKLPLSVGTLLERLASLAPPPNVYNSESVKIARHTLKAQVADAIYEKVTERYGYEPVRLRDMLALVPDINKFTARDAVTGDARFGFSRHGWYFARRMAS
jgi:hypothetical protein